MRRLLSLATLVLVAACDPRESTADEPTGDPAAPPALPAPSDMFDETPESPPRRGPIELAFVGDIILGRYVLGEYASLLVDDVDPFAGVRELLRADLLVGNLETPLVRRLPARSPLVVGRRFGADAQAARVLAQARFDALGVANNHATDLRRDGLRETPEILHDLGIAAVGAAQHHNDPLAVVTLERAGWKIALVAATTFLNTPLQRGDPEVPVLRARDLPQRLGPHLAEARRDHDLVVVLLHWGQEFEPEPEHFQRATARQLLDAGADLVVGHHPHVLQGLEAHAHGLVAYSLGNFLFANFDERSRRSGVLRVRYEPDRRCPVRAEFDPVWLGPPPTYTPERAPDPVAGEIIEQVRKDSRRLRTPARVDGPRLVLEHFPACDS